jgi:hypothetical protein
LEPRLTSPWLTTSPCEATRAVASAGIAYFNDGKAANRARAATGTCALTSGPFALTFRAPSWARPRCKPAASLAYKSTPTIPPRTLIRALRERKALLDELF